MKVPKTKSILKYVLIIYIGYLVYTLPKTDWEKGRIVEKIDSNGKRLRYAPKQSSYIKYIGAWWSDTLKKKGITGILDEHVLKPLGLDSDEKK